MGRKPKPTAVKIAEGNPGKRPLNMHEPKPVQSSAVLEYPPDLSKRAREKWDTLAEMLLRIRVMTEADRATLTQLCEYLVTIDDCKKLIAEKGHFVMSPNGYEMTAPWVTTFLKTTQQCLPLWREFGCTPSSRSSIQVTPEPEANPFEEWLGSKKRA